MAENGFEPQSFGKYLLAERIGAGGMAEIFRAIAFGVEGFAKELCIKRILPTLTSDETFVKMFVDEAKIAVNLHNANIVQVFDLGRIGEHYFIAMELVRGRDLLAIINRCRSQKRRMPVHVALYILGEVCKGLDFAHRVKAEGRPLGIIHRDVSPSNILVSWEGEVKVADFGIAKAALKDEKTVTGTLKGKYGYMSPEQVKGETVDHRSDIFAAGILLYECLVGKRLFKGDTDLETLEQVRAASVPQPPSAINKKVPPEVDQLVLHALSLDPANRYQTAGEFHAALADRLFATGKRVDSKTLAEFMHKLFPDEVRLEEERARADPAVSLPPGAQLPPGIPGPPTRRDLPPGMTPLPRRRWPSWAIGLMGSGLILALAALAVGLAWWLYTPAPPPPIEPPPLLPPDVGVPPPPPVAALGTLEVRSEPPGAAIELDGSDTGRTTPAVVEGLDRSRTHQIRLRLAGRNPWMREVRFEQAERLVFDAQLAAAPPAHRPPLRRPPDAALGTLNVNAVPVWAYVVVDGVRQPKPTPLYNLQLPAGRHTIRLENPKLGLVQTRKVTLARGETIDLVVEMK